MEVDIRYYSAGMRVESRSLIGSQTYSEAVGLICVRALGTDRIAMYRSRYAPTKQCDRDCYAA
jgi:hypothetical protein